MDVTGRFAHQSGIRIHFLDSGEAADPQLTPLLHLPGGFGGAESFIPEIEVLAPRRCISMAQRGRGKSDAPAAGYTLEHYVRDIEAVVEETRLERFILYAFSFSVPSAWAYAVHHPEKVTGIVIGDYPARYPTLGSEWVEKYERLQIPGVDLEAVRSVQRESREVQLWETLRAIRCPSLILRGGDKGADPKPILTDEEAERYRSSLKDVSFFTFEGTGHRLWDPDPDLYVRVIREFMNRIDATK